MPNENKAVPEDDGITDEEHEVGRREASDETAPYGKHVHAYLKSKLLLADALRDALKKIANKKAEQYDSDRSSGDSRSHCKSCGSDGIYGKEPNHRGICPVHIAQVALAAYDAARKGE